MISNKVKALQAFTASRLLLAFATAWVIVIDPEVSWNFYLSCVLLGSMEITDWVDGVIARRNKLVTPLGGIFDPYMDSLSRIIVFSALASAGRLWWLVPAVVIFRDITVSYMRQLVIMGGGNPGARTSGKWKAIIQGSGTSLILLSYLGGPAVMDVVELWVGWAVLAATLYSLADYGWGWLGSKPALMEILLKPKD